jgi:hypothetical protein
LIYLFGSKLNCLYSSESGCPYNLKNLTKEIQNRLTESSNDLNSSGYKTDDTNLINKSISKINKKYNVNKKRGRPFKNIEKNDNFSQEFERLR